MAYASEDSIEAAHYNAFATSLNAVWGSGSGVRGLGQSDVVAAVSAGDSVTAAGWATLLTRLKSLSDHQGNDGNITIDSVTNPSAGDSIAVIANIATDIGTLDTSAAAGTNAAGFSTAITDTAVVTGSFDGVITQTDTLTFASANQNRYFWNGGGKVTVSWAIGSATTGTKATQWTALATECGTWTIFGRTSSKVGGSATGTVTQAVTNGFDGFTGSAARQFKQTQDTSPYTANNIELFASNTSTTVITLSAVWTDGAADTTGFDKNIYNTQDAVNGSKTTTFSAFPPATTYISASWGTGGSAPAWATTVNTET